MPAVAIATLVAALLYTCMRIKPLPVSHGKPALVVGIGYHLVLLPGVAVLPAPAWVRAAGFGWLLFDTVLGGAVWVGLDDQTERQLRQGIHILTALWVAGAAWTGGIGLTIVGTLFALILLVRTWLSGTTSPPGPRIRNASTVLSVAWLVAMAIALGA